MFLSSTLQLVRKSKPSSKVHLYFGLFVAISYALLTIGACLTFSYISFLGLNIISRVNPNGHHSNNSPFNPYWSKIKEYSPTHTFSYSFKSHPNLLTSWCMKRLTLPLLCLSTSFYWPSLCFDAYKNYALSGQACDTHQQEQVLFTLFLFLFFEH